MLQIAGLVVAPATLCLMVGLSTPRISWSFAMFLCSVDTYLHLTCSPALMCSDVTAVRVAAVLVMPS